MQFTAIRPCCFLLLLLGVTDRRIDTAAHGADTWRRHTIDNSSQGADGIRLLDVNQDGLLDIATGWEEGGQIRVYLHPGASRCKSLWPGVTVGEVDSPEDAVFADLDRDGAVDLISCCEGANRTVYIHWAPRQAERYLDHNAWTTKPILATSGKQLWMFALPVQVDGQHGVDLIVGSKGVSGSVSWLQSPANPRSDPWALHQICPAGWIMSLRLADVDQDGDKDLLVSDRRGTTRGLSWFELPTTHPEAAWRQHRIGGADREVMFVDFATSFPSAGAVTGGAAGANAVIAAAVRSGPLSIYSHRNRAGVWKLQEIPIPPRCGTGKAVAMGDIDGDGAADLVFTCENANKMLSGVRWLERVSGRWVDHEISGPEGTKFDRVELLDLDGDLDLDVLTCEERNNLGVIWYENPR